MSRRNTYFLSPTYQAETSALMVAMGVGLDSTAYFEGTAFEITGIGIWNAVDGYIVAMKNAGLWAGAIAEYLMIAIDASTCKWNAKNPADTDAAFRLTFSGGNTFDGNGWTGNGVNGYADTHLKPLVDLSLNSTHINLYQRNSGAVSGANSRDSGCFTAGGNPCFHLTTKDGTNTKSDQYNFGQRLSVNGLSREGDFLASRTSNVLHTLYREGSSVGTVVTTNVSALPNQNFFLMNASTNNTTPIVGSYSNSILAYASIGPGYSAAQAAAKRTIIRNFQIAMFRNVT